MRKNLLLYLGLLSLLAVTGCQNATTTNNDAIVGNWKLSTITSSGLTFSSAGYVTGTYTFSFTSANTFTGTLGSTTIAGTWSKSGTSYSITIPSNTPYAATLTDNILYVTFTSGSTYNYVRN